MNAELKVNSPTSAFRWDPRTRLLLVLCLSALALLCNSLYYLVVLLAVTCGLCLLGRSRNLGISLRRLRQFMVFFVMLALLQSIFNPSGQVLLSFKGIDIVTTGGIRLGVIFLCRMTIIMCSAKILSVDESRRIIQGLIEWRMPYELAFMVSTALHFVPVFADEIKTSLMAIQLRGVDIKHIPLKKRVRIYTYILLPATGNTIVKAKQMALAMEMRAFRANDRRTSYIVLKLRSYDYLAMALILIATVLVLLAYYGVLGL